MAETRYLLDTHTLIWFQENNPKIPEKIMEVIQHPDNEILFSQISLFEITIKLKIGKLPQFYATVEQVCEQGINDNFSFITIKNQHIYNYHKIPLLADHQDPFDRLLIATAIEERATIISFDEKLTLYPDLVKVLW